MILGVIRRINVKCTKLAKIRPTRKALHNCRLPAFLSNESSSAQSDGISSDFSQVSDNILHILVPSGRDPSGLRQELRPLAAPNF